MVVGLSAEQPKTQQPAFRSGVELVAVDFVAVTKDGQPVADLAPEELTLKVDGRVRPIRSLQLIELARPGEAGLVMRRALPLPFGSNRLADAGRLFVLAIDDESIRPGREGGARAAIGRFLTGLSARDRVALLTVPQGPIDVGPTRNHAQVHEALRRLSGQAPHQQSDSDRACHTRETLTALSAVLKRLVVFDGPKTVLFLSSGLLPPRSEMARLGATTPCDVRQEYFDEVADAANAVRAYVYVIQSDVLGVDSDRTAFTDVAGVRFGIPGQELAGLESLAGVTGGVMLRFLRTGEAVFARVASESSAYYLLGFEPVASERNGASHRIELRLARDQVTLRARPGFTIPKAAPRSTPRSASAPQTMLREASAFRDLPLRAVAYVSRNPGDSKLKVVALAEPLGPSVSLTSASVGLFDSRGRLAAQWTAQGKELEATPMMAGLVARAGTYRLRVAATDAAGRRGAVDYELEAYLTPAGPLSLSALVLGVGRGDAFAPSMHFGNEPEAVAYLEIYGTPRTASFSASLQLTTDPDGPPLATGPLRIVRTEDEDRRIATGVIPIAGLAPGDYLVQAVIEIAGQPPARVIRTLRKTGR